MKVAVATLGCKVNQYESAGISEELADKGFSVVSFNADADIYIVNTCTVTGKTDYQSRQLIRKANRRNPAARIIATGCYAQIAPDILAREEGVWLVVGTGMKEQIPRLINDHHDRNTHVYITDPAGSLAAFCPPVSRFESRTRAYLKIQDGCDARCSYCIVPRARGPSRSVPVETVVNRLHGLAESGFSEVVLTGIHCGDYGRDCAPPTNLAGLLQNISTAGAPSMRLRLSSIEPMELTEEIIYHMRNSEMLCRHFHIPLQSGDDGILSAMNRHYTAGDFQKRVDMILSAVPDAGIGIDVMAGFPGECESSFETTFKFIENLPISYMHVFPYSKRPGTSAASLPGQVPEPVKKERCRLLRELGLKKRRAFYERFVGHTLTVLVESGKDRMTGFSRGFSDNYIPVLIENAHEDMTNGIVRVRALSLCKDGLMATRTGD